MPIQFLVTVWYEDPHLSTMDFIFVSLLLLRDAGAHGWAVK